MNRKTEVNRRGYNKTDYCDSYSQDQVDMSPNPILVHLRLFRLTIKLPGEVRAVQEEDIGGELSGDGSGVDDIGIGEVRGRGEIFNNCSSIEEKGP